jgi:hypothetical protein
VCVCMCVCGGGALAAGNAPHAIGSQQLLSPCCVCVCVPFAVILFWFSLVVCSHCVLHDASPPQLDTLLASQHILISLLIPFAPHPCAATGSCLCPATCLARPARARAPNLARSMSAR